MSFLPIFIVSLFCFIGLLQAQEQPAKRPNFLLIIADDLCWRDLGCMGNADVHSPHLDRLASEGMTLNHMYNPATSCSPTRHALYTGLFPMRSGAHPNHTHVDAGTKSLFTHLNAAGYRTALTGKTHIKPASSFPYETLGKNGKEPDLNALRQFIQRDPNQPWMAVWASHNPHNPWKNTHPDMYKPAEIQVPSYYHDTPNCREMLAAYYAEITDLDEEVGQCMEMLEQAQQASDTIVLFVSEQGSSMPFGGKWTVYDNGVHAASFVRWPGKIPAGRQCEALMQYVDIPATFLAAAGIPPAELDTGCPDATGARSMDGINMLDVWLGQQETGRDLVYFTHTTLGTIGTTLPYPIRAVRNAQFKYIRNLNPENRFESGLHRAEPYLTWEKEAQTNPALAARLEAHRKRPAEELYDLEADPLEEKNLAAAPEHQTRKQTLSKALDAWMTQQKDAGTAAELAYKSRQGRMDDEEDAQEQKGQQKRPKKGKKR
jgi:N-sulfoglucosamine sulfohydrolase